MCILAPNVVHLLLKLGCGVSTAGLLVPRCGAELLQQNAEPLFLLLYLRSPAAFDSEAVAVANGGEIEGRLD